MNQSVMTGLAGKASTLFLASSGLWLAFAASSHPEAELGQDLTPEQVTFFETSVRPILANNCFSCHGAKRQVADLRLDSATGVAKGGASGKVIVPGDPDASLLIKAVRHDGPLKMPKAQKLPDKDIATLEAWVKMGAPWPKEKAPPPPGQKLWSLEPVSAPTPPKVKGQAWVKNPIDSFILAKLEQNGMAPNPPADPRTLIRRLSYDLTGLPPSAAEVDAFLADKSPTAYEKVVDRLLASPRYGERWARHWLDVARYADTKGYVFEEDRNYPHAYTYRQWVINALNKDLPYDKFITQQLAADVTPEVANGDDKSDLAALGFLTVGRRFLNHRPDIIDDRIDVTMRGFQGLTVSCARCHDHKFDPVPTKDYYSLYGVFNSTNDQDSPISPKAIRDPWNQFSQRVSAAQLGIRELVMKEVKTLRASIDRQPEEIKKTLQMIREEVVPEGMNLQKLSSVFEPDSQEKLKNLQKGLEDLIRAAPRMPEFAMAVSESGTPSDVPVFKRGNPATMGEIAPRRFLAALSPSPENRPLWRKGSGRLELAQAIASDDNPLTARVAVNRLWLHHFGEGIVRTPSDFGHQGEKPTHPELLDYLANRFMDDAWSLKKMHRLMVTSATYRQTSGGEIAKVNKDPDNKLWARMNRRRLDLEQTRDTLMAAGGRLDLQTIGGRSVDIWQKPFAGRRAIYGFVERQNLPGTFRTFDFASPDVSTGRRFQTTVPQQALFFMNSALVIEQAQGAASRPEITSAPDKVTQIKRLYRVLFGRSPSEREVEVGKLYLGADPLKLVEAPGGIWRYGFGGFANGKVNFKPLPHFGEVGYTIGPKFPDPELGYLLINGLGAHPGRDAAHSVIRRWVAPADDVVKVQSVISHEGPGGDGVTGRVIHSRRGLLGQWRVQKSAQQTLVNGIEVKAGDTLDFLIDPNSSDDSDATAWSAAVFSEKSGKSWVAEAMFGPPPPPSVSQLTLYVQALMMTNEFVFVD